ncbi:hypothetical protein B0H21DRAFT_65480 [Amylocystis lapponica]|nr:hypothetical protein B0H21DRAFT_65480 [Amylocystis lapponica]
METRDDPRPGGCRHRITKPSRRHCCSSASSRQGMPFRRRGAGALWSSDDWLAVLVSTIQPAKTLLGYSRSPRALLGLRVHPTVALWCTLESAPDHPVCIRCSCVWRVLLVLSSICSHLCSGAVFRALTLLLRALVLGNPPRAIGVCEIASLTRQLCQNAGALHAIGREENSWSAPLPLYLIHCTCTGCVYRPCMTRLSIAFGIEILRSRAIAPFLGTIVPLLASSRRLRPDVPVNRGQLYLTLSRNWIRSYECQRRSISRGPRRVAGVPLSCVHLAHDPQASSASRRRFHNASGTCSGVSITMLGLQHQDSRPGGNAAEGSRSALD